MESFKNWPKLRKLDELINRPKIWPKLVKELQKNNIAEFFVAQL